MAGSSGMAERAASINHFIPSGFKSRGSESRLGAGFHLDRRALSRAGLATLSDYWTQSEKRERGKRGEAMNNFDKKRLLESIANIAPRLPNAENESNDESLFLKKIMPVPDYRIALERDCLLVLGGRGVGKTELFRLLANQTGRQTLVKNLNIRGLPPLEETIWIAGFGLTGQQGKNLPSPDTVENQMKDADGIDWQAFWIGLMLGALLGEKSRKLNLYWVDKIPEEVQEALVEERLPLLSDWLPLVRQNLEKINYALDRFDKELVESDRWLFVIYDELDRILPLDHQLAAPIRELLAFWLLSWRHWERIRPKIFLRTDLFREDFLGFPDASKLRAHEVRLEWDASWLYRLLVKRLANSGAEMRDYLEELVPNLISDSDSPLGWLASADESRLESAINKMIGKFMGNSPIQGYVYSWIPNHLQDTQSRITPRTFLRLFSLAAERRLEHFDPTALAGSQLLKPSDLQEALIKTSDDRIQELAQEAYPWLEALKTSLKGFNLPIAEATFLEALQNTEWSELPGQQPPSSKPAEVLEYLLQLGIVEISMDRRVNMPKIYMYGFGLTRRGGRKRRK